MTPAKITKKNVVFNVKKKKILIINSVRAHGHKISMIYLRQIIAFAYGKSMLLPRFSRFFLLEILVRVYNNKIIQILNHRTTRIVSHS
jgi:hypothetical protein